MKTKEQQDYEAAFNDEGVSPEDMQGDVPSDDAPEGDSGAEASAVTIAEGAGQAEPVEAAQNDEAPDDTPEEKPEADEETWRQKYKTLEGKYKAEVPAMIQKIRDLESKGAPRTLAEGGKVGEPEALDDPAAEQEEPAPAGDSIDAIKSEAMDLAADPEKLNAVLKTMIEDYGREFVVGAVALAAPLIDAKAESYVNDVNGSLESLVSEIQQAFSGMHKASIADAHEDFEEVVEGEEFKKWLDSLDEAEKAKAEQVVESGSAGQVVKLLGKFKDSLKASKEPSPEDVWAEDAATSVRSSAPLSIPSRAPMSDDDEYKRAFDAA